MATWREKFERLSREQEILMDHWRKGMMTRAKTEVLRMNTDNIAIFLAEYKDAGQPDHDTDCPD